MKLEHLKEPRLRFATGEHVCPRRGITTYGVFDKTQTVRRTDIFVGGVGSSACMEALSRWFAQCGARIEAKPEARQPHLFSEFCGFNLDSGFGARFISGAELSRTIRNSDIERILKIENFKERVSAAVELYYEEIKFIAQNRHVDVIVCVVPDALHKKISSDEEGGAPAVDDRLEATVVVGEMNFRRALKAKAMHLAKPLQLIRAVSLESNRKGQQDDATKAWNFCTALYYKCGPNVPWKLLQEDSQPTSCAVGIAFYRSRDYQSLNTSLAQIFDELGNGLILRGTPVDTDKDDRIPHLSQQQAYDLLYRALNEYRVALKTFPGRVVVHKSSNFTKDELEGFLQVSKALYIDSMDFVTVLDASLRLFREGNYPPYRGTLVSLDQRRSLLYSRGSVFYYRTYPGLYVPQALDLRIVRSEESPAFIAREILGLTKMNWNNTQFDGKYPVTLGCARKVGEVLKYLGDSDAEPQIRYGYYM